MTEILIEININIILKIFYLFDILDKYIFDVIRTELIKIGRRVNINDYFIINTLELNLSKIMNVRRSVKNNS